MRAGLVGVLAAALLLMASPSPGQETPIAACDRLAADPQVALEDIDAALARTACEAAIQERPSEPRLLHQYARTLEASGETDASRRLYEWLAADAYPPSQFALGRLIEAQSPGSPEAARLFAAATTGGYDPHDTTALPVDQPIGVVGFDDIVAVVGSDPGDLLTFVNVTIAPDAYAGAMRGAMGTLWARAGSAADKALLLAALLRSADPASKVRLASCQLAPAAIENLVATLLASKPDRPRPLLEAAGPLAPQIENPEIRDMAEGIASIWTRAVETSGRHAEGIVQNFRDGGIEVAPTAVSPELLRANLATHHWVQFESGNGWIDLDPSIAGGAPGQTLCEAETTSAELDASLRHRLKVEVILEERLDDAVAERSLLVTEVPTTELLTGGLSVMFAETVGIELPSPEAEVPDGVFRYTPLIRIDGHDYVGEAFDLPQPKSAGTGIRDMLGGFGDVLDVFEAPSESSPQTEGRQEKRQETNVVAAWLEVTTTAPGGSQQTARAPLFDRLGFASRSRALMPESLGDLVEAAGDYRELLAVWDVALLDGRYSSGASDANALSDDELEALLSGLRSIHGNYDLLREALYEAVSGPASPRFVRLQAGVSLLGWIPDEQNAALANYLMDVVLDPALPLIGSDARSAGVRAASSVIAERLTASSQEEIIAVLSGVTVPETTPLDVAALFDAAADQTIQPVVLTNGRLLSDTAISAEASERIKTHLREGRVLIAPSQAVELGSKSTHGWWILDSKSGLIRDQMENGRHQGAAEQGVTQEPGRRAAPAYRRGVGERVFCVLNRARAVLGVIAVLSGDPTGEKVMKDAISLEQKIAEAADKTRRTGQSVSDPPGGCGAGG
jgi:hypothetical protein